jgi:hypothetical protein
VTNELVSAYRLPNSGALVAHNSELLVEYNGIKGRKRGHPGFWAPFRDAEDHEHCLMCFSRLSSKENPILLCEGIKSNGSLCGVGRHFGCLPASNPPLQLDHAINDVHFFCPQHLGDVRNHFPSATVISPITLIQTCLQTTIPRRAARREASFLTPPRVTVPVQQPVRVQSHEAPVGHARADLGGALDASARPFRCPNVTTAPVADGRAGIVAAALSQLMRNALENTRSNSKPASAAAADDQRAMELCVTINRSLASLGSDSVRRGTDGSTPVAAPAQNNDGSPLFPTAVSANPALLVAASIAAPVEQYQAVTVTVEDESESDFSDDSNADPDSGSSDDSSGSESSRPARCQSNRVHAEAPVADAGDPVADHPRKSMSIRTHSTAAELEGYHRPVLTRQEHDAMFTALKQYMPLRNGNKKGKRRRWFAPKPLEHLPDWDLLQRAKQEPRNVDLMNDSDRLKEHEHLLRTPKGKGGWASAITITADFAEYKSCCGSPSACAPLFATQSAVLNKNHTSANVVKFFEERIRLRAVASSLEAFSNEVATDLLLRRKDETACVNWLGGMVCVSCYRALLGVSRSTLHRWRQPDEAKLPAVDGGLKPLRSRSKFDFCKSVLLEYCEEMQQCDPAAAGSTDLLRTTHVLPHFRISQLRDALNDAVEERAHGRSSDGAPAVVFEEEEPRVTTSTLKRVIEELEFRDKIVITFTKSKAVCRCNDCEKIDCRILGAKKNSGARDAAKADKREHLRVASAQREHFNLKKREAMKNPLLLWAITFDGFDQSKTQIPHRPRASKELDGEPLIGMHWVGAYAYGAPVPVLAFCNDESIAKDSSLSCTILFKILEIQWDALERKYLDNLEAQTPQEAARGVDVHTEAAKASNAARYAAEHWPARIHLTFDNAAGEAKNQYFFRTAAALVHYGVFEAITLSTMLVGHTHDIVDQMFRFVHTELSSAGVECRTFSTNLQFVGFVCSVWSVMLRIKCVHTLSQMKALFRKCYHSKIGAITALFNRFKECAVFGTDNQAIPNLAAPQPSVEQVQSVDCTMNEFLTYVANDTVRRGELAKEEKWTEAKKDRMRRTAEQLADVAPEIFDIDYSIDIKGWLRKNKEAIGFKPEFTNLNKCHKFSLHKDAQGNTYLYNSFLADSVEEGRPEEQHHFPKESTGSYSTRSMMFTKDSKMPYPPSHAPHRAVAQNELRATIAKFGASVLNLSEQAELLGQMDRMRDRVLARSSKCAVCADLTEKLAAVGVISNKPSATKEEKLRSSAQQREKGRLMRQQADHLDDPEFTELHTDFVDDDWFGRWHHRANHFIVPDFASRSSLRDLADQMRRQRVPYHMHPDALCSGRGERRIYSTQEREDCRWLHRYGPPKAQQLVVLRSDDKNEPFWLARILRLLPNDSVDAVAARAEAPSDQRFRARDADRAKRAEQLDRLERQRYGVNLTRAPALPIHPRNLDSVEYQDRDAILARFWQNNADGCQRAVCYEMRASVRARTKIGQPTSIGLFATRDVKKGDFVTWYGGYLMWGETLKSAKAPLTHARRLPDSGYALCGKALADAITRFVAKDEDSMVRQQTFPPARFHPREQYNSEVDAVRQLLQRFDSMPKGFLINSAGTGAAAQADVNVKTMQHACSKDLSTLGILQMPYMQATRDIAKGEEFLTQYHSAEENRSFEYEEEESSGSGAAAASASAAVLPISEVRSIHL